MTYEQENFVKGVYYSFGPISSLDGFSLKDKFKIYDYLQTCEWSYEKEEALDILFIDILQDIQDLQKPTSPCSFSTLCKSYWQQLKRIAYDKFN